MPTNAKIVAENLLEEDYRIEFRFKYKLVKLLEKKLELEKTSKSEYIRQLILEDIKKIISTNNTQINTTSENFNNLLIYIEEVRKLQGAVNKLGVLINQAIGYKIFQNNISYIENSLYNNLDQLLEVSNNLKKILNKNKEEE